MNSGKHAKPQGNEGLRALGSIAATVLLVFVLAWALTAFIFSAYSIPSGSMENTIEPGDMIFSEKVSYYFREPEAGDIVTFQDPENANRTLVKRVIATGGQTVDLVDGQVVVDGEVLDEPYTEGKASDPQNSTITYPYTVPEGYLWVMGDNRENSQDSRSFGAVSVDSVTGRACFVYWQAWDLPYIWESSFWEEFWDQFHLGVLS